MEVYIDGACKGNPGLGGYGAVIYYKDCDSGRSEKIELYGLVDNGKKTTNNRAELTAAIVALQYIEDNFEIENEIVKIYSDSQMLVRGITGVNKRSANLDLFNQLDELNKDYYRWNHVLREFNKEADKLANRGCRC